MMNARVVKGQSQCVLGGVAQQPMTANGDRDSVE